MGNRLSVISIPRANVLGVVPRTVRNFTFRVFNKQSQVYISYSNRSLDGSSTISNDFYSVTVQLSLFDGSLNLGFAQQ